MTFVPTPKQECPRCHQRTISFWRKPILSHNFPMTCPACGTKVYISFAQSFGFAAIAFGGYKIAELQGWDLLSWLILGAGIGCALLLSWFSPLLELKTDTPISKVEQ